MAKPPKTSASPEGLQFAVDAARLGTFYCNWPFDQIVWNATCKEHFFLPLDAEVDFALFYSLLHPDDREPTREAIDRAMAERVEYNVEYRTLGPAGQTRWVNAVGRGTYGPDGVPIRFDGITINISARKQTEQQLAQAQQRERNIATQLQQALQPQVPKHLPGLEVAFLMTPALNESSVGGDFADVFALDKEQYALVIGDVSGKGLAAAAQLATVRNMLRGVLYEHRRAAHAVTRLNAIVTLHDLLAGFVTLFVGLYDAQAGRLAYASCGHEPGLLYRASSQIVQPLEPTGPPLGVAENALYAERSLLLSPRDALLLYTDGLSEAGPTRRELLGTEGLKALFQARAAGTDAGEMASGVVDAAHQFAGGQFRDDVCVLLARRT